MELDGVLRKNYLNKVQEILELVGFKEKDNCFPYQLSGGQQQRVAIARAIIIDPKIIFADEPTGNLDTNTGYEILSLLDRLNKQYKKTIVMVTHDHKAASFSSEVITIRDGIIES